MSTEPVTGELVTYTTPQPLGVDAVPGADELGRIMRQADVVSRSGIVPMNYRTTVAADGRILQDKRPNVVVATLMGRTFGWDLLTAMRNIHVIEGAATLKPEAQLGLLRARGHRVKIVRGPDYAEVTGIRADTGDELTARFTFADAVRAGLCGMDDKGNPVAVSQQGKPLPWQQYPVDMCQWRAVAIVCRALFSDVVMGLGYTPEEMGELVTAEGEVVIESAPMPDPEVKPEPAPEPPAEQPQPEPTPAAEPPAAAQPEQRRETLAEELARVQRERETMAGQRQGPPLRIAQSRAWDAVRMLYTEWTRDELQEETKRAMRELGTTVADATTEQWHALAQAWEDARDEGIKARHGNR